MAKTKTKNGSKNSRTKGGTRSGTLKRKSKVDTALSIRTKKQIDSLPEHAQHIFKKAHASAVKQYQEPEKRRGGKSQSAEEVAHKAAWAAVKQKYKKQGREWVSKE
jgi:cation transport regulator